MKIFFGSMAALVLLVIALLIWSSLFGPEPQSPRPFMGEKIPNQGSPHVARGETHPDYNSNPPTSGWHCGDGVAGAGIKKEEVPDEKRRAINNFSELLGLYPIVRYSLKLK